MTSNSLLHEAGQEVGIIATDNTGTITIFNHGAEKLLGYGAQIVVGHMTPLQLISPDSFNQKAVIFSSRLETKLSGFEVLLAMEKEPTLAKDAPWVFLHENGENVRVMINIHPIKDKAGAVSGHLFMLVPLMDEATLDPLTSLPNQAVYNKVLDREYKRMRRDNLPLGIMKVNIDGFAAYEAHFPEDKTVLLLKKVANTLNGRVKRAGDLLAYWGKDEFAILLPSTDEPGTVKVAEQIRLGVASLEIPAAPSQSNACVTISVGMANKIPSGESSPAALIDEANTALQLAKKEGGNCSRFYSESS